MNWILLAVQALVSSAGLLMLRYSMPLLFDRAQPTAWTTYLWGGFGMVLYAASFFLWLYILSKNPVSFAYPITIGLTLAFTVLGSTLLLKERVTLVQVGGILLMAVAVFLLSWGTSSGETAAVDRP